MLTVKHFNSDQRNDWLVTQFESYEFRGDRMADKFIPRPCISLIFHFKNPAAIVDKATMRLERFFAAPIVPKAFILQFNDQVDTLAITCKASVFSRLFKVDMSPVTKKSIDLPKHLFFPVWDAMNNKREVTHRIRIFSEFLLNYPPYEPDPIDKLYQDILDNSISASLTDIMKECFASRSTLLRNFKKRTGVNPKMLARIVRID